MRFEVWKLKINKDVNNLQSENVLFIYKTLYVLKFDTSKDSNELHPENMPSILITF